MSPGNKFLIDEENIFSGALSCRGCGWTLLARYVSYVMGQQTVYVVPACCFSIISGPNPMNLMKGTVVHTLFAAAAATATGVRHALDRQGKTDTPVVVLAGDGGTFDIGLQALSGAAARQENIIYICNNNAAYMNTGVQSSTGTPSGVRTSTDPAGKKTPAKNLMGIVEAHNLSYYATASPAFLTDLENKLKKARDAS
ncbi:MAG: pyruvate synthase subunit beta, partial [Balneolaceae bacterium]